MCHCESCKRRSGGVASYAFVVPKDKLLRIDAGQGNIYYKIHTDYNTGSGKPMQRSMCTECGSPVIVVEAHSPDVRCVQYGMFAHHLEDLPPPRLELFRRSACGWVENVGREIKEEQ